jgi:hypothetical protein
MAGQPDLSDSVDLAHIASHMAGQPNLLDPVDLAQIASHMAGQRDLLDAVDLAQISKKIQNPGKLPILKRKVINSQEGKFKVSNQEISQNA